MRAGRSLAGEIIKFRRVTQSSFKITIKMAVFMAASISRHISRRQIDACETKFIPGLSLKRSKHPQNDLLFFRFTTLGLQVEEERENNR